VSHGRHAFCATHARHRAIHAHRSGPVAPNPARMNARVAPISEI
jgi:hypothetical protein